MDGVGIAVLVAAAGAGNLASGSLAYQDDQPSDAPSAPSALEILKQRYARGESDTPTFEAMRERLQATSEHETR